MSKTIETVSITQQPTGTFIVATVRMPITEYPAFIVIGELSNALPDKDTAFIVARLAATTKYEQREVASMAPFDAAKTYLLAEQAAAHCGLAHGAFLDPVERGEVPHLLLPGGVQLFTADALDGWLRDSSDPRQPIGDPHGQENHERHDSAATHR